MSSWKSYGGINKFETKGSISADLLSINKLNLREVYQGNFDICGQLNIFGGVTVRDNMDVSGDFAVSGNTILGETGTYLIVNSNSTFNSPALFNSSFTTAGNVTSQQNIIAEQNVFVGNVLYFESGNVYSNSGPFLYGNVFSLGLNTMNPKAALDISTNLVRGINIISYNNANENILAQNILQNGVSLGADLSSAHMYFYVDDNVSSGNADGLISYSKGGYMNIDVSKNLCISAPTTIAMNVINTHNHGEMLTIYDVSSGVFFGNVYQNNCVYTGSSASFVSSSNTSNTFIYMGTPSGAGGAIGGGSYPVGSGRTMTSIGLTDTSGNYTPGQTIVSGNALTRYYTTTGVNTFQPRIDQYVLDVNGPLHIDNGDITDATGIVPFELYSMNKAQDNPNVIAALGSSIDISGDGYTGGFPREKVIYTTTGGKTWSYIDISNDATSSSGTTILKGNTFTGIHLYDSKNWFISGFNNQLITSFDSGNSWQNISTPSLASGLQFTNIYINKTPNAVTGNLIGYITENPTNTIYIFDISAGVFNNTKNQINIVGNTISINNPSSVKADTNTVYIAGSGIGIYNMTPIVGLLPDAIYPPHNQGSYYYTDIKIFDNSYAIAVGTNIISTTLNRGASWTDVLFNNSPGFTSVHMIDNTNAITVGSYGNIWVSNTRGTSWYQMPMNMINSSGKASWLLSSKLFRNITMPDINTILITNTLQSYNYYSSFGRSNIFSLYVPNLINKSNNNVLDVSGTTRISGDLQVNDGGSILSNNVTMNVLNTNVQNLFMAGQATNIVFGNTAGTTNIQNNAIIGGNTAIGGNTTIAGYSTIGGYAIIGGDTSIGGNTNISGNVFINGKTHIGGNVDISSSVIISGNVPSGNVSTGTLIVKGGVGISANVFVGGYSYFGYDSSFNGSVDISNNVLIRANTSCGNTTTGALVVKGGVGIGGNVYIGGILNLAQDLTLSGNLTVNWLKVTSGNLYSSKGNINLLSDYSNTTGGNINLGGIMDSIYTFGNTIIGNTSGSVSKNSGALIVKGGVGIGGNLNVGGFSNFALDSSFNGNLLIGGGVGLGGSLNVGSNSTIGGYTSIGGDTSIGGNVFINGKTHIGGNVDISASVIISGNVPSGNVSTGTLVVKGGVGISANVFVGGYSYFGYDSSFNGSVDISKNVLIRANTISNNATSGALIVGGGVGIGGNVYVGGALNLLQDLTMSGNITVASLRVTSGNINSSKGNINLLSDYSNTTGGNINLGGIMDSIYVFGNTIIGNTSGSTSKTSGAFVVNGGVGIGGNLNIGGFSNFALDSSFNGNVIIGGTRGSIGTTTGAVTVNGGVGIGGNLNVGGFSNFAFDSSFNGNVIIGNALTVNSVAIKNGATISSGGMSIANGGLTMTNGGLTMQNGSINLVSGNLSTNQIISSAPAFNFTSTVGKTTYYLGSADDTITIAGTLNAAKTNSGTQLLVPVTSSPTFLVNAQSGNGTSAGSGLNIFDNSGSSAPLTPYAYMQVGQDLQSFVFKAPSWGTLTPNTSGTKNPTNPPVRISPDNKVRLSINELNLRDVSNNVKRGLIILQPDISFQFYQTGKNHFYGGTDPTQFQYSDADYAINICPDFDISNIMLKNFDSVLGTQTIGTDISVLGNANISANITAKNITFTNSLISSGNVNLSGNVAFTGNTTAGNLLVSNIFTTTGNVFMVGNVFLIGNTTSGNLTVTNTFISNGNTILYGNVSLIGNTTAGNLLVTKTFTTTGNVFLIGNTTSGNLTVTNILNSIGNTILSGNVSILGNISLTGNTILFGNVGIGSLNPLILLDVSGSSRFIGPLVSTNYDTLRFSNNYGYGWQDTGYVVPSSSYFQDLATSYDGKYQYALIYNKYGFGSVNVSSNSGVNWTNVPLPSSYAGNIIYQAVPYMSSNTTTFQFKDLAGNISLQNAVPLNIQVGTYIASGSSSAGAGSDYYMPFDNSLTSSWTTATNSYSSGSYTGSYSTLNSGNGVSIGGEYVQIQLPYSFVINNYKIYDNQQSNQFPKLMFLFGSNNGSNWYSLLPNGNTIIGNTTTTVPVSNNNSYNFYRFVVNSLNGGNSPLINRLDLSGIFQNVTGSFSSSIAASGSGQYVLVANQGYYAGTGNLYLSSNYGQSFSDLNQTSNAIWQGVALSQTGQYQTAIELNRSGTGSIYLSSNYGAIGSWIPVFSNLVNGWQTISISATGQYITAIQTGNLQSKSGNIWVSSNYGSSWTSNQQIYNFTQTVNSFLNLGTTDFNKTVAISSGGQYQTALGLLPYNGISNINANIWISSNYGSSWSDTGYQAPIINGNTSILSSVSMTGLGQNQVISYVGGNAGATYPTGAVFGNILISSNYGSSWIDTKYMVPTEKYIGNTYNGYVTKVQSALNGQYVVGISKYADVSGNTYNNNNSSAGGVGNIFISTVTATNNLFLTQYFGSAYTNTVSQTHGLQLSVPTVANASLMMGYDVNNDSAYINSGDNNGVNTIGINTTGGFVGIGKIVPTVALDVNGTTNISGNANIGGGLTVNGNLNIFGTTINSGNTGFGNVSIVSTLQSTSTNTGALTVAGGVGVSGNLNVGGNTLIIGSLTIQGTTNLSGSSTFTSMGVTGSIPSTSSTTGAFVAYNGGGLGVTGNLNIGGFSNFGSDVSFNGNVILASQTSNALGNVNSGSLRVLGGMGLIGNMTVGGFSNHVLDSSFNGNVIITSQNSNTLGNVNSGALRIFGGMGLIGNMTVGGFSNHILDSSFNGNVLLTSQTSNTLGNVNTGALKVFGGMGLSGNMTVGGFSNFISDSSFNGNVLITSQTSNTLGNVNTGALKITGGMGLSGNMTVGGFANFISDVSFNGNVLFLSQTPNILGNANSGTIRVSGIGVNGNITVGGFSNFGFDSSFNGNVLLTSQNSNTLGNVSTGALKITGGMGLSGNMTVGGFANFISDVSFNGNVLFLSQTPNILGNANSGTIRVSGIGINGNMTVGGFSNFGFDSSFNGNVVLTSQTSNTLGNVNSGSLRIFGGMGLIGNMTVGGFSNFISDSSFNGNVIVSSQNSNALGNVSTGALKITGGMGLSGNITVGGFSNFISDSSFNGNVIVSSQNSNALGNVSTGALKITGGMGLSGNITVGGFANFISDVSFNGNVLFLSQTPNILGNANSGTIRVSGIGINGNMTVGGFSNHLLDSSFNGNVLLTSQTSNTLGNVSTGALKITGGMGLIGNMTVGGFSNFVFDNSFNGNVILSSQTSNALGNVNSGSLRVFGGIGLTGNMTVGGFANFISDVSFNGNVLFTSQNPNILGNVNSGTIRASGVGISGNMTVGGFSNFISDSSFNGNVLLTSQTSNALGNVSTGALKITGGMGLSGNMTVGGFSNFIYDSSFNGNVILSSQNSNALGNVNSGSLRVFGGMGLIGNMTVGGFSNFISDSSFNGNVILSSQNSNALGNVNSGSLRVFGGMGLIGNMTVGGFSNFISDSSFNGNVILSSQNSNALGNVNSGSLRVFGGMGLIGNMTVGGFSNFVNDSSFNGNVILSSQNSNALGNVNSGSLRVFGGIGLIGNITVGGFSNHLLDSSFNGNVLLTSQNSNALGNVNSGSLRVFGGMGLIGNMTVGGFSNYLLDSSFNGNVILSSQNSNTLGNVNSGSLRVFGGMGLIGNMTVGGFSNHLLDSSFNGNVILSSQNSNALGNVNSGSLRVFGGMGLIGNMTVGGFSNFVNDSSFNGNVILSSQNSNALGNPNTGSLRVFGGMGLIGNMTVGGFSNHLLDSSFNGNMIISSQTSNALGNPNTGSLRVFGGMGLIGNMTVGGFSNFVNDSSFNGNVLITSQNPNILGLANTGSLTVFGGMGLSGNMTAGGFANFMLDTSFNGNVSVRQSTESYSKSTGALTIGGGIGIGGNINVGGYITGYVDGSIIGNVSIGKTLYINNTSGQIAFNNAGSNMVFSNSTGQSGSSYNTVIGYLATNAGSNSNTTVIGYNASATGSNQVVLGGPGVGQLITTAGNLYLNNTSSYVLQQSSGIVNLNAPTGGTVNVSVNNTSILSANSSSVVINQPLTSNNSATIQTSSPNTVTLSISDSTNPGSKLSIYGNAINSGNPFSQLINNNDIAIIFGSSQNSSSGGLVIGPYSTSYAGIRMDSNGRVGINTTVNPSYSLNVGDSLNCGTLYVGGTPFNSSGQWSGSNPIYYNGSVGINYSIAPTGGYNLDVAGTLRVTGAITGSTTNTINGIVINNGALTGVTSINATSIGGVSISAGALTNVSSINATSIGGVSISAGALSNVTSISASNTISTTGGGLSVSGAGAVIGTASVPNAGVLTVGPPPSGSVGTSAGSINCQYLYVAGVQFTPATLSQWSNVQGNISYSGNVSIGSSSNPLYTLDVNGINATIRATGQITGASFYASGLISTNAGGLSVSGAGAVIGSASVPAASVLTVGSTTWSSTAGTVNCQSLYVNGTQFTPATLSQWTNIQGNISYAGNVSIGSSSNPLYTLDVNGTNGTIRATGQITGLSFNATSDYRMKTNIKPLEIDKNIDELNPVEYDLSGGKHDMGFLAHEVQEIFPFLVEGHKDDIDKTQSLNYNGFIALLVKEVQELKKENNSLKVRLETVEKKLFM